MNPAIEYRQLLESKGISLQSPGTTEVALTRADAMLAASQLRKASLPILGGDVYFRTNTGIKPAYANWRSNPADGEDRDSFVARSCIHTMNYIEKFPSSGEEPIFVLVIDRYALMKAAELK